MMTGMMSFLRKLIGDWQEKHISREAAALAFYSVFSLPAFLLILLALLGLIFDTESARATLFGEVRSLVGKDAADLLQVAVSQTARGRTNIVVTSVGACVLLLSAVGLYLHLRAALRSILAVGSTPRHRLMTRLTGYALSFLVLFATAIMLATSVVTSALIDTIVVSASHWLQMPPMTLSVMNSITTTLMLTAFIALLYAVLPGGRVRFGPLFSGAFCAAVLVMLGKTLVTVYLGYTSLRAQYGLAASVLVLLFWLYYAASAFFFGAEVFHIFSDEPKIAKKR